MIVLPAVENRVIVCSFLWTKHRNATEGPTDRQNRYGYYSGLHCEQCLRAVEIVAYELYQIVLRCTTTSHRKCIIRLAILT